MVLIWVSLDSSLESFSILDSPTNLSAHKSAVMSPPKGGNEVNLSLGQVMSQIY